MRRGEGEGEGTDAFVVPVDVDNDHGDVVLGASPKRLGDEQLGHVGRGAALGVEAVNEVGNGLVVHHVPEAVAGEDEEPEGKIRRGTRRVNRRAVGREGGRGDALVGGREVDLVQGGVARDEVLGGLRGLVPEGMRVGPGRRKKDIGGG